MKRAGAMGSFTLVTAAVACGGHHAATLEPRPVQPATVAERMLRLLPDGAQIVVELDLARLRANPTVGRVVTQALAAQAGTGASAPSIFGVGVTSSPLAGADLVVLAAYGVGTAQAATVTLLVTKADVPGSRRLTPELVAVGPSEWLDQLEVRAQLPAATTPAAFMTLREHAMPPGAPGAALRITARLPFDARVALARQTGLDAAPAQLSVWADVVDDLAIVVDADAADPGDRAAKTATKRLTVTMRGALASIADAPTVRALGIPSSLAAARLVAHGSWLRTIIAIGPAHLQRVIERATALLGAPGPS